MNLLALAPTSLAHTPPLPFVEASAEAGFEAVGLRLNPSPGLPYHPVVGNAAATRELKRAVAASGMKILDILSFYLAPTTRLEDYWPALELGAELGAKHTMMVGDDPEWSRMRDNFAAFCDKAAEFNIRPAIEFVPMRRLSTLQMAVQMCADAGRRNGAILVDGLHFTRAGGKPSDLRGLDPALFPYAQFTDGNLGPGEPDPERAKAGQLPFGKRCILGEGKVPMWEILAAMPPGIPLSIELMPPDGSDFAPAEWAKRVLDASKLYLANNGKK